MTGEVNINYLLVIIFILLFIFLNARIRARQSSRSIHWKTARGNTNFVFKVLSIVIPRVLWSHWYTQDNQSDYRIFSRIYVSCFILRNYYTRSGVWPLYDSWTWINYHCYVVSGLCFVNSGTVELTLQKMKRRMRIFFFLQLLFKVLKFTGFI